MAAIAMTEMRTGDQDVLDETLPIFLVRGGRMPAWSR